jgi:hypothetical protein
MRTFQLPTLLLVAALAAAACTSDSPSEPRVTPSNPIPAPPVITYTVSVNVVPGQLQIGAAVPATVNVQVRRADNGQAPPDGSDVVISTTLGALGTVSGPQQVTADLVGGNASIALFAGTTPGQATIRATFSGDSGTTVATIEQPATFFIGSVNPQVGDPQGGGEAVINGGGFDPPVRVTFGNAAANVRSVGPNQIRVQIPSATAAGVTVPVGETVPVAVSVTINVNEVGTLSDSLANGFSYAQGGGGGDNRQPVIFSVTPTEGTNDGGTEVTINGQNFGNSMQVFFEGGTPLVSVEGAIRSLSATRITVLSPAARGFGQGLQNQRVNIRVKNVVSGFESTTNSAFRYGSDVLVTSVSPGQVVYNIPQSVTIHGQGFDDPVAVSLAGIAAAVLSTTGTEIVVRSPVPATTGCADVSGPINVVNIETGDGAQGPTFIFRVPRPIISNLSPTSGPEAGGTSVTLTGSGFEDPVRVNFGDQAGSVISVNPNQIVVRTPRFTGTFTTLACDDNGDGTQGSRFQPLSVDVRVTNLITTCVDTFQRAFTYTPTDTSCRNDVGPPPAAPVAAFSFQVGPGRNVNFFDTSTGTVTSRLWNFNDGGTSTATNPSHLYALAGTYHVALTVTGPGGSNTVIQDVVVP